MCDIRNVPNIVWGMLIILKENSLIICNSSLRRGVCVCLVFLFAESSSPNCHEAVSVRPINVFNPLPVLPNLFVLFFPIALITNFPAICFPHLVGLVHILLL